VKRYDHTVANHHCGMKIVVMELADKFTTAATRWHDPPIRADSDHLQNTIFAGGDHGSRRRMFGAKAHRTGSVDTDTGVHFAAFGQKGCANAAGIG
jgi:hypothetical protein